VQQYDYWKCVLESCAFCQQLSLVAIFAVLFIHMLNAVLPIDFLIMFDVTCLIVGFVIYFYNAASSERTGMLVFKKLKKQLFFINKTFYLKKKTTLINN